MSELKSREMFWLGMRGHRSAASQTKQLDLGLEVDGQQGLDRYGAAVHGIGPELP